MPVNHRAFQGVQDTGHRSALLRGELFGQGVAGEGDAVLQQIVGGNVELLAQKHQGFQAGFSGAALNMPHIGVGYADELGQLLLGELQMLPLAANPLA